MRGTYEIVNLHDGKATAYVGSSVDIKKRWRKHRWMLREGRHDNIHLQRAWSRDGADAFEWSVIEEVTDTDKLLEREQHFLDCYFEMPDSVYNIARDASASQRGLKHTNETRQKISIANRGRKLSEATRRKMSEAMTGRSLSEEHKRNLSRAAKGGQGCLGYKHTSEARRRMSEYRKGKKHSDETRRKMSESQKRRQAKKRGYEMKGANINDEGK